MKFPCTGFPFHSNNFPLHQLSRQIQPSVSSRTRTRGKAPVPGLDFDEDEEKDEEKKEKKYVKEGIKLMK